jgi:site-specific recombinase XerD
MSDGIADQRQISQRCTETGINPSSIFRIVRRYGRAIGKPKLAPHDMRRTFAENLQRNGHDVVTINSLLGHESIETTRRYLNVDVDLTAVGADLLPW